MQFNNRPVNAVRRSVHEVDKGQPVSDVKTMEEHVSASLARPRLNSAMVTAFAGLALTLAAIGLYGLMSYAVGQRTHEIGIRMALGAERRDVLRLILRQGLVLTFVGAGLGLAGAFGLTRLLANMLYGVTPTDPLTFAAVSAALIIVAGLASYVPARRATKVDPMVALRCE